MTKDIDYMELSINELRKIMKNFKRKLVLGELSYEEAKEQSKPVMDAMNYYMIDLCFELNRKIKTLSFHEVIKHLPYED